MAEEEQEEEEQAVGLGEMVRWIKNKRLLNLIYIGTTINNFDGRWVVLIEIKDNEDRI